MTERERLIELIRCCNDELIMATDYELADYLISNGVIVQPCKVGDKVYVIRTRNKKGEYVDTIVEKTVQRIEIGRNNCMWLKFGAVDGDSVNSTYITYGEAEKALKEHEK